MGVKLYQIAILELDELLGAFVFVHRVIIGNDALSVHSSLGSISWCFTSNVRVQDTVLTSAEHFETAWANRWIGRVFGCMAVVHICALPKLID
jgi:hypothetical protein